MNDRNLAKISKKLRIKWNFELTVFELSVPDLYYYTTLQYILLRIKVYVNQPWEETIFDEKKNTTSDKLFIRKICELLQVKASRSTECKLSINSFGILFVTFCSVSTKKWLIYTM